MSHSPVEVFHGKDLDDVVDKAYENCPIGYEVVDLTVDYLNDEWVIVAKIAPGFRRK